MYIAVVYIKRNFEPEDVKKGVKRYLSWASFEQIKKKNSSFCPIKEKTRISSFSLKSSYLSWLSCINCGSIVYIKYTLMGILYDIRKYPSPSQILVYLFHCRDTTNGTLLVGIFTSNILSPGPVKEYMRDPVRPWVSVDISSVLPPFVPLDNNHSIFISICVVPYVIALDWKITVNISFNLGSFRRFTNIFSRFVIYYRKLAALIK